MRRKLLLLLTMTTLLISSSVSAFGASVDNKFLGINYEHSDEIEVGYSYVDTGYGYFEYINPNSDYYDEAITIIANDLSLTGEVTDEELQMVQNGELTDEKVAEWFAVDPSEFTKETINGKEYYICEILLNEQDRVYYITYEGTVEYQFCMPASSIDEASSIIDLLETVTYVGASGMLTIAGESVDLYFDDIGAGIQVPDFSVYYFRGMDADHPNWARSYENYDDLMGWMNETNTYAYILSDDIYDEIHLYSVDSYSNKNLDKASVSDLEGIRDGMKTSFEGQGHGVEFIDDGIYEGANATFIALKIADASGYDSQYYYTSDGKKGYVLECFYYEDEEDEEFLNIFENVVDTLYIGASQASAGTDSSTGAQATDSGSTPNMPMIAIGVGVVIVVIIIAIVMSKKKKKEDDKKDDLFS